MALSPSLAWSVVDQDALELRRMSADEIRSSGSKRRHSALQGQLKTSLDAASGFTRIRTSESPLPRVHGMWPVGGLFVYSFAIIFWIPPRAETGLLNDRSPRMVGPSRRNFALFWLSFSSCFGGSLSSEGVKRRGPNPLGRNGHDIADR
ncbi:uncharacterized protein A4U43_C01F1010 [Asparagus officinalis]|uniref:Uncharacterized protein n=1 Tax=Asparagus officinalis TaxID=4686 RepID=A0A5P1FQH3_ASPOF|nr:uncharacterized protein A4U43_C01F1010 [Asparagus officinalis]